MKRLSSLVGIVLASLVGLGGGCPRPEPHRPPPRRPRPAVRAERPVVLGLAELQGTQDQIKGVRLYGVRVHPDGRVERGTVVTLAYKDTAGDLFLDWPKATLNDRHLYYVETLGGQEDQPTCRLHRRGLFDRSSVRLDLGKRCPTALLALRQRLVLSAQSSDGESGEKTRILFGEVPARAATLRVSWFHELKVATKPTDFFAVGGTTLVAVDDVVSPKFATVFARRPNASPRYRYTASLPLTMRSRYHEAAAMSARLFVLVQAYAGSSELWQEVIALKITPTGLVQIGRLSEGEAGDDGVGAHITAKGPPREVKGVVDTSRLRAGSKYTTWRGLAVLRDRLLIGAGSRGVIHFPVTVGGGVAKPDESDSTVEQCDDASGKWTCRQLDLTKKAPQAVRPAPRGKLFPLGGECLDLVVRQERGYALVKMVHQQRELVVVQWSQARRNLEIVRRVKVAGKPVRLLR